MKQLTSTEKAERIYAWLNRLNPGDRINITVYDKHERDFITSIVKEYIDMHPYGNGIEFNSDYTYVLKKDISILYVNLNEQRKIKSNKIFKRQKVTS